MKNKHKLTRLLTSVAMIGLATGSANAAISIGVVDFDSDNGGFFTFANTSESASTTYPAIGVDGTNGVGFTVNSAITFVGGGVGSSLIQFDLSLAGITPGAVTLDDVNTITGSFDINVPNGLNVDFRIEPRNGGNNDRINLGTVSGTGEFQTIAFSLDSVSNNTQKTAFFNQLNSGDETGIKFVYQVNNDSEAAAVGNSFIIDNVEMQAVPEPSSAALLGLGALGCLIRRKR